MKGFIPVDKMKVPGARILTWPWLANSLHMCGQYFAIDSIERAPLSALGDTLAWLQGCRRAEAGVVAAPRTEAQRMAVQAEILRGRDWLVAYRLALSEWILVIDLPLWK